MNVKEACIRFEKTARALSYEIDKTMKLNQTRPILTYAYVWESLALLSKVNEISEALDEATTKRSRMDRLREWWRSGNYH